MVCDKEINKIEEVLNWYMNVIYNKICPDYTIPCYFEPDGDGSCQNSGEICFKCHKETAESVLKKIF